MQFLQTVAVALVTGLAFPVAAGTNALVSAPGDPSATGAAGSYLGSFSPDGRYVVFISHANNLVTNDSNAPFLDVFARDLLSSTTTLISVGTNGRSGGDDNSPFATMSTNGLVAFESAAGNLVTNDTNRLSDVFLRNLITGTTTAISVQNGGNRTAKGRSTAPLISQDGRRIVFESTATNLLAGSTNQFKELYVCDLVTGITTLVSSDATNAGFAPGPSESASISADGRYVAFVKRATNNLPSNRQSQGEIYVRDLETGTTTWASVDVNTNFIATIGYPYSCSQPVLSTDGRYVAFFAEGGSVGGSFGTHLFRHDLINGITIRLAMDVTNRFDIPMSADGRVLAWIVMGSSVIDTGLRVWDEASGTNVAVCFGSECATAPALSPDGSQLAYFRLSSPPNPPLPPGLYIYDQVTGTNRPISITIDQGLVLPAGAAAPDFSPNGQQLAFEAEDARLVPGDANNASDVFLRDLELNTTELISTALPELPSASAVGMASLAPGALSADGRFLAFTALDSNLAPGDNNQRSDVFVRDLLTGGIVAASARAVPSAGGGKELLFDPNSLATSTAPVISGDGRVVAYRAWEPWKTSTRTLYWRDLAADQPISIPPNGSVSPTNTIALNHDGRVLLFDSDTSANVFTPTLLEFNSGPDVFLRDMVTGTNTLISINHAGTGTGNLPSFEPKLSPDGQWVAFLSKATNLTTNGLVLGAGASNAYVRHLPSGRTRLLSTTNLLGVFVGQCYGMTFSALSDTITFGVRRGSSIAGSNIYQHDLVANSTRLICRDCQNPSVSADGRIVAYDGLFRSHFARAIIAKDMATDFESLISISTNGVTPASMNTPIRPMTPQISRDGRYVVFFSHAPDLVSTDTNTTADLFAHDRITHRTFHLTASGSGTGVANGLSSVLVLAGDGRTIAIQSHASDLVPGDYNFRRDVFLLRLAEPDGDGDGMDDDWEMAYFDTLARDGTGDFDGDGASDTHEFRAGTDPTNTGSILRVISLTEVGGAYRLFWVTEPGLKYQVQYRNDDVRVEGWANLGSNYTATTTTGSQVVHSVGLTTNRFYRVVRLR